VVGGYGVGDIDAAVAVGVSSAVAGVDVSVCAKTVGVEGVDGVGSETIGDTLSKEDGESV
jgi:hypothetical protein